MQTETSVSSLALSACTQRVLDQTRKNTRITQRPTCSEWALMLMRGQPSPVKQYIAQGQRLNEVGMCPDGGGPAATASARHGGAPAPVAHAHMHTPTLMGRPVHGRSKVARRRGEGGSLISLARAPLRGEGWSMISVSPPSACPFFSLSSHLQLRRPREVGSVGILVHLQPVACNHYA